MSTPKRKVKVTKTVNESVKTILKVKTVNSEEFKDLIYEANKVIAQQVKGRAIKYGSSRRKYYKNRTGNLTARNDAKALDHERIKVWNPLKYAPYVHNGTGIYAPGGRQTPWTYYDEKNGKFYTTRGQKPKPWLKDAIDDSEKMIQKTLETFITTWWEG